MTRCKAKIRRPLRQEAYLLLLVFALPALVAAFFPYEAIGFKSSRRPSPGAAVASCAFTTLDADAEAAALAAARSMRGGPHERIRSMSLNLSAPNLPEEVPAAHPRGGADGGAAPSGDARRPRARQNRGRPERWRGGQGDVLPRRHA